MIDYKKFIRDIPDFPKKGIIFKDITPLLLNPEILKSIIDDLYNFVKNKNINKVASVEARGFIFGALLAQRLNVGFIPIRKKGKLPYKTISETYSLEYGTDTIQMHIDAVNQNDNVLILDDVLATGGTALACANLVNKAGGRVDTICFIIELEFLKGKEKLKDFEVFSLVKY